MKRTMAATAWALFLASPAVLAQNTSAQDIQVQSTPAQELPGQSGVFAPTLVAVPSPGAGAMRSRVQNVFDPATRQLQARSYVVFDPRPDLRRDFIWLPDDPGKDRDGPLNGAGRLTWRTPGTALYDPAGTDDVYTGPMRDGRPNGTGVHTSTEGWVYEGTFRNGLFHGQGRFALANGEVYVGAFRNGYAQGNGQFVDLSGEIFDGSFSRGQRQGEGRTTLPGGLVYRSRWVNGVEAPHSVAIRVAQLGNQPATSASADTIRLGVTARTKPRHSELQPAEMLSYVARPEGDRIRIVPDDAQLVSVWKNGGLIEPGARAMRNNMSEARDGLFSFDAGLVYPPTLVFEVQNRSTQRVEITDFYLDVKESVTDNQPALQIEDGFEPGSCAGTYLTPGENDKGAFLPKIRLRNFGWAAVERATYSFSFEAPRQSSPPGTVMTKDISRFDNDTVVDLTDLVGRAGGNIAALRKYAANGFRCQSKETAGCLAEVRATGAFGALGDRIRIKGNAVEIGTNGKLEYSYKDAKGTMRTASAPLRANLTVGGLQINAECGGAGPPEIVRPKPVDLKLDQSGYRVPLPFRRAIEPGRNNQYVLAVTAEKSSTHDFQVVAKLSDGREIRSRPVNLLLFKPRQPAS